MTEYTLVFRRAVARHAHSPAHGRRWIVTRPAIATMAAGHESATDRAGEVAQVFVVPICSALGLDGVAYEHFLLECGVLRDACALLGRANMTRQESAETARKEVQALVMAAEVQHIIDRMSA